MEEKRRQKRFNIFQMIQMSIGKEKFIQCEGLNISKSGMLFKTNAKLDQSARFYMLFEVELEQGKYEIRCEGMIVRMKEIDDSFEVGVQFSDLFEDDEKILEMYIQQLEGKE